MKKMEVLSCFDIDRRLVDKILEVTARTEGTIMLVDDEHQRAVSAKSLLGILSLQIEKGERINVISDDTVPTELLLEINEIFQNIEKL